MENVLRKRGLRAKIAADAAWLKEEEEEDQLDSANCLDTDDENPPDEDNGGEGGGGGRLRKKLYSEKCEMIAGCVRIGAEKTGNVYRNIHEELRGGEGGGGGGAGGGGEGVIRRLRHRCFLSHCGIDVSVGGNQEEEEEESGRRKDERKITNEESDREKIKQENKENNDNDDNDVNSKKSNQDYEPKIDNSVTPFYTPYHTLPYPTLPTLRHTLPPTTQFPNPTTIHPYHYYHHTPHYVPYNHQRQGATHTPCFYPCPAFHSCPNLPLSSTLALQNTLVTHNAMRPKSPSFSKDYITSLSFLARVNHVARILAEKKMDIKCLQECSAPTAALLLLQETHSASSSSSSSSGSPLHQSHHNNHNYNHHNNYKHQDSCNRDLECLQQTLALCKNEGVGGGDEVSSDLRLYCRSLLLAILCPRSSHQEVVMVKNSLQDLEDQAFKKHNKSQVKYCWRVASSLCLILERLEWVPSAQ